MDTILDFILSLLQQFAGGPGPIENNLMRFGLAAALWLVLLVIAWSRQRNQDLPREKLLVIGFALALARELVMFYLTAGRMMGWKFLSTDDVLHHPLEHALAMAAIIVVAGAYIRYMLDNEAISRRYLQVGIGITLLATLVVLMTWPSFALAFPEVQFHHTWQAWVFHLPLSLMLVAAIFILSRSKGLLRNIVILAMLFFFISEILILVNFATSHRYSHIVCPIGNTFHILAIPLLGYVYLKEQSIEKKRAEQELEAYRNQLENLVEDRTAELTSLNTQLKLEVTERQLAQKELRQRNASLAALNAISGTISKSMELETILDTALEMAISVLDMEIGAIFLMDQMYQNPPNLSIRAFQGDVPLDQLSETMHARYSCIGISMEAVSKSQAILEDVTNCSENELSDYIRNQGLKTIVSTPLLSKSTAVGALTLSSTKSGIIHQSELALLKSIGQQIGVAVENASLFEELERHTEELSLLHEVSTTLTSTLEPEKIKAEITQQSAKLLGCQMAYLLLSDQENDVCEIVSSYGLDPETRQELIENRQGCQLLGNLINSRQVIAINDPREDERVPLYWVDILGIRTLLCLPLWVHEEPIEFLFLLDQRGPRTWRPEELKLIEAFANRAAIALENAYLHKQIEWAAALEERQRIAAEMHDGLAQTLSLLGLRIDRTADLIEGTDSSATINELLQIRRTINQASTEVRRSIASLAEKPAPIRTLQDQLADLLDRIFVEEDISTNLSSSDIEPLFISPYQTAQLLPIVQEALLNARNHASPRTVTINLCQWGEMIQIDVIDDGKGFDQRTSSRDDQRHFGLSIMRARANRIGGTLSIESAPGRGSRVSLVWHPEGDYSESFINGRIQAFPVSTEFHEG